MILAAKRIGCYHTDGITAQYAIPFTTFHLPPAELYIDIMMTAQILDKDYHIELRNGRASIIHFNTIPAGNQLMGLWQLRPKFGQFLNDNIDPSFPFMRMLPKVIEQYFEEWVFPQGEVTTICK